MVNSGTSIKMVEIKKKKKEQDICKLLQNAILGARVITQLVEHLPYRG